jgi:hypothetical protein
VRVYWVREGARRVGGKEVCASGGEDEGGGVSAVGVSSTAPIPGYVSGEVVVCSGDGGDSDCVCEGRLGSCLLTWRMGIGLGHGD